MCDANYILAKSADRLSDTCTLQNVANCAVHVVGEQKCKTCNDGYYPDTDGSCKKDTIPNCVRYDQTAPSTAPKCLVCARNKDYKASYALDNTGANCIGYSTTTSGS